MNFVAGFSSIGRDRIKTISPNIVKVHLMVFSWWVLLPSGRMQSAIYKLRHSPAMHVFGTIRLLHCGCPGLEWWDNWHRTPPIFSLKAMVSGEDFHGKPTLSAAVHLRIWICFIHSAIAKSLCNCPLCCGAPPVFFAMAGNFFWNLGEIMGKYRKVWDIPELALEVWMGKSPNQLTPEGSLSDFSGF